MPVGPVNQQSLLVSLQYPRVPFRVCIGGSMEFKDAISNGIGITVNIRHACLPRIDSEGFYNYAAIVRNRVRCGENRLERLPAGVQYHMPVIFPIEDAVYRDNVFKYACKCESTDYVESRVDSKFSTSPLCEHCEWSYLRPAPFSGPPWIEARTESRQSPLSTRIPPVGKIVATTLDLYALQQSSLIVEMLVRIHPHRLQYLLNC